MRTIYHIVSQRDWEIASASGEYEGDTLKSEGFIHFSRPHQVLRVANARFKGRSDLVLLQVNQDLLLSELKYEDSDGDKFPHLYGALNLDAVVGVFEFKESAMGFEWPKAFKLVGDTLVRFGHPGDEAEITSCHTHGWQQSYRGIVPDSVLDARPLSFRARLSGWREVVRAKNANRVYVAESAQHGIVGFCAVGPANDESMSGQGEIGAIYCLNEYKGKGVGKALFRLGLENLKTKGFSRAYLWVLKDNPTTQFYRHMGGEPLGMEKSIELGAPLVEVAYGWSL